MYEHYEIVYTLMKRKSVYYPCNKYFLQWISPGKQKKSNMGLVDGLFFHIIYYIIYFIEIFLDI